MTATPTYFIVTERLGFRTWTPDDLELAVDLWTNTQVSQFIARGPVPRSTAEERLAREISSQREHGVQYWPIFLATDGAHVGCCGLRPYRPDHKVHELGFHLRPSFWRQGLAFEAANAVVDYAFARLGSLALFAGHHPANTSSRALLLKLGFRYTHDELFPPTGLEHPSYLRERPSGAK